ncbi:hypothetical protein PCE1_003021 [Barthelona sp. PCE]
MNIIQQQQFGKAKEHERQAAAAMKTGLFKWKPDHQTASIHYSRAAENYTLCGRLEKAINCWENAAISNHSLGLDYQEADCLVNVADLYQELEDYSHYDLYEKAFRLFYMNDNIDQGVKCLIKVAKIIAKYHPTEKEKLSQLMDDIHRHVLDSQQSRRVQDFLHPICMQFIDESLFIEAGDLFIKMGYARLKVKTVLDLCSADWLSGIICYLRTLDFENAQGKMNDLLTQSDFGLTDRGVIATIMCDACLEGNEEKLETQIIKPQVSLLDNRVLRLIRYIKKHVTDMDLVVQEQLELSTIVSEENGERKTQAEKMGEVLSNFENMMGVGTSAKQEQETEIVDSLVSTETQEEVNTETQEEVNTEQPSATEKLDEDEYDSESDYDGVL